MAEGAERPIATHTVSNDRFALRTRLDGSGTPRCSYWGADSEYGLLRDMLIGPVDNFKRILPTNSVNRKQIRDGVTLDVEGARRQYDEVLACYRDAGVRVYITPPNADLPLQIWARDGSVMTPWGMVVCQMAQWWRRGEYGPVLDFCNSNDVPIYDKVTAGCFEGGDFMMIEPGAALIGYSGERSDAHGAVQIKRWCEAEGWEVMLAEFDPFFVHMDVMVVMLAPKLAAVCRAIISGEVLDWLKARGIEMIDVPYQQAMAMGCNVVALGGDRVLLPKASTALAEHCRAHGLTVYDPDLSKIVICGGAVHCMSQPLRRDPGCPDSDCGSCPSNPRIRRTRDRQRDARHVARHRTRQIDHRIGDLLGFGAATERAALGIGPGLRFGNAVPFGKHADGLPLHLGLDGAGADRVAADIVLAELRGDRLGQPHDAELGRNVGGSEGFRGNAQHRSVIDDDAAALALHYGDHGSAKVKRPFHMHAVADVPLGVRLLQQRSGADGRTGIVDQHVDRAKGIDRRGDATLDLLRISHVNADR